MFVCVCVHEMELARPDSLSNCSFLILWNEIENGVPSTFHFHITREKCNEQMKYSSILVCNSLVKSTKISSDSKIDAIVCSVAFVFT